MLPTLKLPDNCVLEGNLGFISFLEGRLIEEFYKYNVL